MRPLEEQIKDKIISLINEKTDNPERDKEITLEIFELRKILDFRLQHPEK
jgi:hypothetical protein